MPWQNFKIDWRRHNQQCPSYKYILEWLVGLVVVLVVLERIWLGGTEVSQLSPRESERGAFPWSCTTRLPRKPDTCTWEWSSSIRNNQNLFRLFRSATPERIPGWIILSVRNPATYFDAQFVDLIFLSAYLYCGLLSCARRWRRRETKRRGSLNNPLQSRQGGERQKERKSNSWTQLGSQGNFQEHNRAAAAAREHSPISWRA